VAIQQVFSIEQLHTAFDAFTQGTLGKVVVTTDCSGTRAGLAGPPCTERPDHSCQLRPTLIHRLICSPLLIAVQLPRWRGAGKPRSEAGERSW
jgi:hypothetical protein